MIKRLIVHWRGFIVGFALALIASEVANRWLKSQEDMHGGVGIVVMGGMLELPSTYWLNSYQTNTQVEFTDLGGHGESVLVGPKSELSAGFWDWVQRTKQTEGLRCGLTVVETMSEKVKATLVYDDKQFVMFAGVSDSVVNNALKLFCETRRKGAH